jgi:WD40 repeat protein
VLFLPNGYLASGSEDGILKIWNTFSLSLVNSLLNIHTNTIRALAILRNAKLVSADDDSTIIIWDDYLNGSACSKLKAYGPVYSLTVLPNGNLISGTGSGYVEFWDTNDLKQIKYLYQGELIISALSSLPNGDLAICLSNYEYRILKSTLQVPSLTFLSNRNLFYLLKLLSFQLKI